MPEKSIATLPKELVGLRAAGSYDFDQLYRFAQICHASGLFEDVGDAAQAFVKIAKGQELGIPPTTAMSGFDLIKKRLFIKPWVIAAKINACGYGSYRVTEQTPERCTIVFARKYPGEGWVKCEPATYTFVEAKAHGLVDRSPHWKASPAHMLYQRCMGRGGAMYFPELLAGLEAPQDDAPIPPARHQQNIVDLFGDGSGAYATEGETLKNAREGTKDPRMGGDSTLGTTGTHERNLTDTVGQEQGMAWETLQAHQDDARLPVEVLEQIRSALSAVEPATDSEAHTLANAVLDILDDAQRR